MEENLAAIKYNYHYRTLKAAQNKIEEIKEKFQEDNWETNPILLVHPKADKYTTFDNLVCEPYVRKINLPYEEEDAIILIHTPAMIKIPAKTKARVPNKNPDEYLKPLDVVWVKMNTAAVNFYHVGVYLGNGQVCQFSKARKGEGVIITD